LAWHKKVSLYKHLAMIFVAIRVRTAILHDPEFPLGCALNFLGASADCYYYLAFFFYLLLIAHTVRSRCIYRLAIRLQCCCVKQIAQQ